MTTDAAIVEGIRRRARPMWPTRTPRAFARDRTRVPRSRPPVRSGPWPVGESGDARRTVMSEIPRFFPEGREQDSW